MDKNCQSCGMSLKEERFFSSNADGSANSTYCLYCYKGGKFIDGCTSLEQKIEDSVAFATRAGMSQQEAEELANSILPKLWRWKNE